MEWAGGIEFRTDTILGYLLRRDGTVRTAELATLLTTGLPDTTSDSAHIQTDFSQWRVGDTGEYSACWSLALTESGAARHVVFEVAQEQVRVLIPALSLIRSIFRPTGFIFASMFSPQALDRVCHLDASELPPKLVVDSSWPESWLSRHGDYRGSLAWMKSFPSASAMAASVHEYARVGRIGLDLPRAIARMTLFGRRVGDTLFTTSVRLCKIVAAEEPFPFAVGQPREVRYRTSVREVPSLVSRDNSIPRHRDGSVDLTDAEWEVIEPILVPPGSRRRRHDPRYLFDGILRKHGLGLPWDKTPYRVGKRENAVFAYQEWTKKGTYAAAIQQLKSLRTLAV